MTQFVKLFEPGKIGNLQLKNRIIMPPLTTQYTTDDGRPTEEMIDYYAARARGGCGLIVVEAAFPRPGGYPRRLDLGDDRVIPDLRKLAEAIHNSGAKAALQMLNHRGRGDALDPAGASESINPVTGEKIRAMSASELKKLVEELGKGARRAKEAGFDCIGIHGAHGHIVSELLSPKTNKRTDEYGGDVKNRARFALELAASVRENVGADFPIIFRLGAHERVEGGYGLEDGIVFAKLLEEAGVDALDICSGIHESIPWILPYIYASPGTNTDLSEVVKKEVKIPIAVAGKINTAEVAEKILGEGKADFVDIGRALIVDAEFPNKVKAGKLDDICRCTACCQCIEFLFNPSRPTLVCSVNPAVGREKEFEVGLRPTAKKKKILIIGGGPGGMEAAIITAQREHDVTLWEKEERLGGQLNIAVVPPGKEDLNSFFKYLKRRFDESKLTVKLGKEATAEAVLEFSPDVVIVAVGAKPLIPEIRGLDTRKVVSLRELLLGKVDVGKMVIVVGGGFVGCEAADFLTKKGKEVTIVEILPQLATEILPPYAQVIAQRLDERGVVVFTGVKEEAITDKGMAIIDKDGKRVSLEADDIVIATGAEADKTLSESLKGKVPELYEVGDCVEARKIREAIHEGATAGLKV